MSGIFNKMPSPWRRLARGAKSPNPIWSFKISQVSTNSVYSVCKTIDSYLERFGECQFLVSHIKPHKPVPPSTFSSWLGQVLVMAGINTEVFKAHSTQSASSSKVEVTGVSLKDIIKQGHWSQAATFQRFYRKDVKEYDSDFQSRILKKQHWREEIKIMTSSFSDKGQAAVLDRLADISRSET